MHLPLTKPTSREMIPAPMPRDFPELASRLLLERPDQPKPEATKSSIYLQEGIRRWSLFDRQVGVVTDVHDFS